MKKSGWMALGLLALAACFFPGGMALAQAAPQNSGVHFITDVMNVEDFAPIDGTNWVIGSSLSPVGTNPKGPLYVFNTKTATASASIRATSQSDGTRCGMEPVPASLTWRN